MPTLTIVLRRPLKPRRRPAPTSEIVAAILTAYPQVQVKVETRNLTMEFQNCVNAIMRANPATRDGVANIVMAHLFACHTGGRHVAILDPTPVPGERSGHRRRLAIVTSNAPDFN